MRGARASSGSGVVGVYITATTCDGIVQTYADTYTVSGGVIVSGSLTQTS